MPELKDGQVVLSGETNLPNALTQMNSRLFESDIDLIGQVTLLESSNAIVNISVANLRSQPKHSAELATQALMGMVVKVYKQQKNWYLIQTPDGYLAWTDAGALQMIETEEDLVSYDVAPKVVFTEAFGFVRNETGNVSDISLGNVLELISSEQDRFNVKFPDGRVGYVLKSQAMEYKNWVKNFSDDPQDLVSQAQQFMGVPYLWGGTSFKGVDCSGFTKMVYLMNGRIIPRDASQQVNTGKLIDDQKIFEGLTKGDLLFFGKAATDSTRERVTHVAMWIGDGKYIHAAGKVKINSMDINDPLYSKVRYDSYLRAKRILDHETDGISTLNPVK
jgi:hypothetical protein